MVTGEESVAEQVIGKYKDMRNHAKAKLRANKKAEPQRRSSVIYDTVQLRRVFA